MSCCFINCFSLSKPKNRDKRETLWPPSSDFTLTHIAAETCEKINNCLTLFAQWIFNDKAEKFYKQQTHFDEQASQKINIFSRWIIYYNLWLKTNLHRMIRLTLTVMNEIMNNLIVWNNSRLVLSFNSHRVLLIFILCEVYQKSHIFLCYLKR